MDFPITATKYDYVNVFINTLAPVVVNEVIDRKKNNKKCVLASVIIAQAILESNWGKSTLAAKYYNLFGVKSDDPNNSKVLRTQEYVNGEWITINGRFQVYASWNASIDEHALLMVNGTTYNSQQYAQVIAATSYQDAAQALQNAGYATDPTYASKLISIIQKYKLDQYDS